MRRLWQPPRGKEMGTDWKSAWGGCHPEISRGPPVPSPSASLQQTKGYCQEAKQLTASRTTLDTLCSVRYSS